MAGSWAIALPTCPLPRKSRIDSMIASLPLISDTTRLSSSSKCLVQVLDELPRPVRALDLAVAEQVHLGQDLRLEQLDALDGVVDRPVVAVAEVERVDVPLGRREVVFDHLGAQLVGAGDHRPARLARVEERVAVDLLGHRVVDDVARLEALVLAAQPGVDPERLDADDLLLLVAHRAGHVHDEDHHRVRLRHRRRPPRAIAAVLAHRHDHRVARDRRCRS